MIICRVLGNFPRIPLIWTLRATYHPRWNLFFVCFFFNSLFFRSFSSYFQEPWVGSWYFPVSWGIPLMCHIICICPWHTSDQKCWDGRYLYIFKLLGVGAVLQVIVLWKEPEIYKKRGRFLVSFCSFFFFLCAQCLPFLISFCLT